VFLVVHNPDQMYNSAWVSNMLMARAVAQLPAGGAEAAAEGQPGKGTAAAAAAAAEEKKRVQQLQQEGRGMREAVEEESAVAASSAEGMAAAAAEAAPKRRAKAGEEATSAAAAAPAALPVLQTPRVVVSTLAPVVSGYMRALLEAWSRGLSGGRPHAPVPWYAPLVPWAPSFGDGTAVEDASDDIFAGDNRLQHLCIQVGGGRG
jgi:hypothetical protein